MLLFVDYIAAKQIIAPALNALVGDPKKVFEASYAQVWEAIRALVKRAIKSGPRGYRSIAGSHRCRQHGHQSRLAAKRQEAGGYPCHRFAAVQNSPSAVR